MAVKSAHCKKGRKTKESRDEIIETHSRVQFIRQQNKLRYFRGT